MFTKRKNTFTTCLVAVLSFVLAACQTLATPPGTPTATQTTLPQPAETRLISSPTPIPTATPTFFDELEQVRGAQLTLLSPWINAEGELFAQLLQNFNDTNTWGISVEAIPVGGYEALAERLAEQGLAADMLIARGYDTEAFASSGELADLRDYYVDTQWGLSADLQNADIFSALAPTADAETLWQLPIAYAPLLLFYEQSWAEELGFSAPPSTPEKFRTQMQAGKQAWLNDLSLDNNGTGGLWLSHSPGSHLSWYLAFGGSFDPAAAVPSFNNPAGEQSLSYLRRLFVDDDSWTGAQDLPYTYFTERLALAYDGGLEDVLPQEAAFVRSGGQDVWLSMPYPSVDGVGVIPLETLSISIAAGEEAQQLASWLFIHWFLSAPVQDSMVSVHGLWPVVGSPSQVAPDYAAAHPAWVSALSAGVQLSLAPQAKNWAFSRLVLQDAFKRAYWVEQAQIPAVLEEFDRTLLELGEARDD